MTKGSCVVVASLLLAALATGCGRRTPLTAGDAGGGGAGVGGGSGSSAAAAGGSPSPVDASAEGATLADSTCAHNAFRGDGGCACQASTPTVCGDTCVDLLDDPDHCGGCDNKCAPTSTCVGGLCGLPPSIFVPTLGVGCGDIDLAVANGQLYWTEKDLGDVGTRDPTTGKLLAFAAGEKTPTRISVRGTNVFWLDVATRTIR